MKREWYVGCRLANGDECRTPFVPLKAGERNVPGAPSGHWQWEADAPDLSTDVRELQSRRMYEAFITTEIAIDTKYPEEMEAKLPPHVRGLTI